MTFEDARLKANEYMLNSFKFQAMADSGGFWPDAVQGLEYRAEQNALMAEQMFFTMKRLKAYGY